MDHRQAKREQNRYRPPAGLILGTPVHLLAFGMGSGLSPKAPGTAGTLAAVPLWLLLQWLPWPAYVLLVAALFVFGCWVCGESSRLLGVHDYGGIVFDEVVGFLVTCLPLLHGFGLAHPGYWWWLLAAFGLFRLFDVWKPWPIAGFDRRVSGGFGIMLDDLIAAIYAAALLALALALFRAFR